MRAWIACLILTSVSPLVAQFAPPAGQTGSTAIHRDSSVFVGWAVNCTVERGPLDISAPSLGLATAGESSMATGKSGESGIVSLGDGGNAVLTFAAPIQNGPGWDFAVFENSFNDTYLELAFVEVSSDGENFFRFPATSNTQTNTQIDGFGSIDATKVNNLAGKYRVEYGTPFDLEELKGETGLDVDRITHVRLEDVVGSILPAYARYDAYGNIINDPWPTPFPPSGLDLEAVGVIHQGLVGIEELKPVQIAVFPNPTFNYVHFNLPLNNKIAQVIIIDAQGKAIFLSQKSNKIDVSFLSDGIFQVQILVNDEKYTGRFVKE